jgi:hypothetical protein
MNIQQQPVVLHLIMFSALALDVQVQPNGPEISGLLCGDNFIFV